LPISWAAMYASMRQGPGLGMRLHDDGYFAQDRQVSLAQHAVRARIGHRLASQGAALAVGCLALSVHAGQAAQNGCHPRNQRLERIAQAQRQGIGLEDVLA